MSTSTPTYIDLLTVMLKQKKLASLWRPAGPAGSDGRERLSTVRLKSSPNSLHSQQVGHQWFFNTDLSNIYYVIICCIALYYVILYYIKLFSFFILYYIISYYIIL